MRQKMDIYPDTLIQNFVDYFISMLVSVTFGSSDGSPKPLY